MGQAKRKHGRHAGFGCLESLAGAPGIVRRAEEWAVSANGDMTARIHNAEDIFAAARSGDPAATRVLDEVTDYLAVGIVNITGVISPEAVVLGGGVARAGETLACAPAQQGGQLVAGSAVILQSSIPCGTRFGRRGFVGGPQGRRVCTANLIFEIRCSSSCGICNVVAKG